MEDKNNNTRLKILVSAVAVIFLILRYVCPNLVIDGITIGLILLALIPWLAPIIKSIEITGIGKVELQDLKNEVEKIKGAVESVEQKAEYAAASVPEKDTANFNKSDHESLKELANKYVETRKNLRSSPERTAIMTKIFKEMVQLASKINTLDVDSLLLSSNHGDRLSAYAYLYAKPSQEKLGAIIESATEESQPFNQYWGIQAIGKTVYQLPPQEVNMKLVNKLERLKSVLRLNTDRFYELNKILQWIRAKLWYLGDDDSVS
jgi:hypothetical protein